MFVRLFSIAGLLSFAAIAVTQNVTQSLMSSWTPGPAGSSEHQLNDMSWWQGPGNQFGIYTVGHMRYGGDRFVAPLFEHAKDGAIATSAYLTANANSSTEVTLGQKIVSGPTNAGGQSSAVYFGGYSRVSALAKRNLIIGKRGLGLTGGWTRVLDVKTVGTVTLHQLVVDRRGAIENVYAAGTVQREDSNGVASRWFLAKYSSSGVFQWLKVGAPSTYVHVAVDDEGSPYVAFYGPAANFQAGNRLEKYSEAGVYQWRNAYNPTNYLTNQVTDLKIIDGGPVIVGSTRKSNSINGGAMAAGFTAAGVRRFGWVRATEGSGYSQIEKMHGSHRMYLLGRGPEPTDHVVVDQVDPRTGVTAWTRSVKPSNSSAYRVFGKVDEWDNIYFCAQANTLNEDGVFVGKYASNGALQWTALNITPGEIKRPFAMIVHPTTGMLYTAGVHRVNGVPKLMMMGFVQKAFAVNDPNMTMAANTTFTSNVWSNDRFHDGGTFAVVTPPASGSLTLQPNGEFSYTPPVGFTGTRTFTYKISRTGVSDSNVATATITVQ